MMMLYLSLLLLCESKVVTDQDVPKCKEVGNRDEKTVLLRSKHITLNCPEDTKVYWTKTTNNNDTERIGELNHMRLSPIHMGILTCHRSVDHKKLCQVIVEVRAQVKGVGVEAVVEAVEYEEVELTCEVSGYPYTRVYFPYTPDDSNYTLITGSEQILRYRIPRVTKKDEGRYECFATNKHGNSSTTTLLRVSQNMVPVYILVGAVVFAVVTSFLIISAESGWTIRRRNKIPEDEQVKVEKVEVFKPGQRNQTSVLPPLPPPPSNLKEDTPVQKKSTTILTPK